MFLRRMTALLRSARTGEHIWFPYMFLRRMTALLRSTRWSIYIEPGRLRGYISKSREAGSAPRKREPPL
jgi:hypothetical protein